jgi:glutathione S-transferase
MLLIGQFDSPYVRRVAIALHHYDRPFEHQPWSVWSESEEIAKKNPLRRVPVLVFDDGETLIDSAAILDAIDERAPEDRRLIAKSGQPRRAVLRVCAFAMGLADKAVSLLYEHILREPQHRSTVWAARCALQIGETLDLLDAERSAGPASFWYGDTLSHADVAVTCAVRFVNEAHPDLLREHERPALRAYAERCEGLPLFQKAMQPLHVTI